MSATKTLPFIVVLIILLLIPRLAWLDRDSVDLSLGVAGAPAKAPASHPPSGLGWILDHIKARPAGREGWGLIPGELSPAALRGLSVLYLTGTMAESSPVGVGIDATDDGASAAGGWLSGSDGRALSAFIARGGAVIAEGGLLPTLLDPEAGWRVEDCFRVRWTGWVGLTVDDIGDPSETPRWILSRIREAGETAPVGGPAVILFKGERVLVLRDEIELTEAVHEIEPASETELMAGLHSRVPYKGWFDVVSVKGGGRTLASHRLAVTDWGAKKLSEVGLSSSFPCIVGYRGAHAAYYLSVVLSQDGPSEFWAPVAGYPRAASVIAGRLGNKRAEAYWRFFYPVMRNIILEASEARRGIGA
jgi:hypothetical protein